MAKSIDSNATETQPQEPSVQEFEAQVKAGVTDPYPYNRLMIAYRKQKKYTDERRVIKRAISVFEAQLKSLQQTVLKGNRKRSAIAAISEKISKQTGLTDKKGKSLHVPEPIVTWLKRQAVVQKKLAAAIKRKK